MDPEQSDPDRINNPCEEADGNGCGGRQQEIAGLSEDVGSDNRGQRQIPWNGKVDLANEYHKGLPNCDQANEGRKRELDLELSESQVKNLGFTSAAKA
jgi:hypothetical protein